MVKFVGGVMVGLVAVAAIGWSTSRIPTAAAEASVGAALGVVVAALVIGALLGAVRTVLPRSATLGTLAGMVVAGVAGMVTSAPYPEAAGALFPGFFQVGAWSIATWVVVGLLAVSVLVGKRRSGSAPVADDHLTATR